MHTLSGDRDGLVQRYMLCAHLLCTAVVISIALTTRIGCIVMMSVLKGK